LSFNPNAISIIEKNLDKVDWENLCKNPNAIHILEKNWNKICWENLCNNPNAIHILEKNLEKWDKRGRYDKSHCEWLSQNPNIFAYDYDAIKNAMYKEGGFVKELMKNRFHPKNMGK